MSPSDFRLSDKLYRGYQADELDEDGRIDVNTIRFPDLSSNWDRFSIPHDVRHRLPDCDKDGCYSFTVESARFESFATPCHHPIRRNPIDNYSHTEVRELAEGESLLSVPPRERKGRSKRAKELRSRWRTNLVNTLQIEFEPEV
jgi:hypothetical protein